MEEHGEEDFDEGEVWDVLRDQSKEAALLADPAPARSRSRGGGKNKGAAVPRADEYECGSSRNKGKRLPSAPVAIPAWCSPRRGSGGDQWRDEEEEGEEEEEDGGEMLPPHEWLARKMERMSAARAPAPSSPEMIRGKSKGSEMRKVRDAVLPKTAFSEK